MKDLIKIMLTLALLFASTFILIKATGLLTLEDIKQGLEQAQQIHPGYLVLAVIGLLFVDLFIAIPTMTIAIMAGFFLGWPLGAAAAITGFYWQVSLAMRLAGAMAGAYSTVSTRIRKDSTKCIRHFQHTARPC